ncbi:hypothetical protein SKAU_G00153380 [Synaphobranchus kaupii]|uniref:Uncharacterized protein n=1 Tax=Synaphobranchus kaupii TaxID=118154 RepID=A0A9Q1FH86_SYNKA|nr:hypothetical protein SKAU_G00153380 [Synaphobranchus kaupii]
MTKLKVSFEDKKISDAYRETLEKKLAITTNLLQEKEQTAKTGSGRSSAGERDQIKDRDQDLWNEHK